MFTLQFSQISSLVSWWSNKATDNEILHQLFHREFILLVYT